VPCASFLPSFVLESNFPRVYSAPQAKLSDMVLRHEELAAARRVPAPRVLWLQLILRADSVYGFEGDENWLIRDVLRGKLASLYQYSAELREHALDRIMEGDAQIKSGTGSGWQGTFPYLGSGEASV